MKTSLLSTVLVLAVVIIVAIIAFIRVKKKHLEIFLSVFYL